MREVKVINRKLSVRNRGRFPGEVEIFFTTKHNINFHIRWSASSKKTNIHTDLEKDSQLLYHDFHPKPPMSFSFCVFLRLSMKLRAENNSYDSDSLLTRTSFFFSHADVYTARASLFSILATFIFMSSDCD